MQVEREYIQLHRDTTVQSLTLLPSVRDGVIVWEDSPLVKNVSHARYLHIQVRAVREGYTLVVDEADKAPLEVVCVLKGLVEDKEMTLSDGRKIMGRVGPNPGQGVIPIHPKFRIVVLANRPGYPFLGNDFFAEIGDCFSW